MVCISPVFYKCDIRISSSSSVSLGHRLNCPWLFLSEICGVFLMVKATAPAKIILFGEHAVVYGLPAIAIPVHSLQATAEIKPMQDDFCLEAINTHENLTIEDETHPLIKLVKAGFDLFNVGIPNIKIIIRSDIPIASGLGSGAATSASIVKSIYKFLGVSYDYTKINSVVYDSEKQYHGTPSGIDNTVIVYEKPIYFIKGEKTQTLALQNASFNFLIGDTGQPASTKLAVSAVKSLYEENRETVKQIFNKIGETTDAAQAAILNNQPEILGTLMNENHMLLQKLTVSSPQLDKLVQIAQDAGAYGAKLSGGGRGGNMIALIPESKIENIKTALLKAGAANVYQTKLD